MMAVVYDQNKDHATVGSRKAGVETSVSKRNALVAGQSILDRSMVTREYLQGLE